MLLKIIGSIIVIAASSFLGYSLAHDCARRPQELRILQGLLQMFENEIRYLSNLLADAFLKISKSSNSEVTLFFKETSDILTSDANVNAVQAWEEAVRRNLEKTALNREDKTILDAFGTMLGNSDVEGQIKNIRLTIEQLKLQEQKAEEKRKKNETMYRSLGVLGGIALVIILI